jgi:hydroxymethylpyrimidine pyrophosphatase-like HAD family hydrolase
LYDFSQENGVHIITYLDGNIIASSESPYIDIETQITGMPLLKVDDFKKAVDRDSVKCIMLDEPERLVEVMAKLKAQINHKSITTSKPFFLEIMQLGIDKAASLDRLAQKLGISSDEIIAVGNASNDLTMTIRRIRSLGRQRRRCSTSSRRCGSCLKQRRRCC